MSGLQMAMHYNLFGWEFEFDRIAFTIGGFSVYWYGVIIAVGFTLALIYGFRNAKRLNINVDKMIDVIIVGLIGAIVCARGFYIIFDKIPLSNFPTFGEKIKYICGIHSGGLAIFGGIIGAFVLGGITAWVRKVKVLDMFDLAALGFLIGQCVGRWGNFINQEVYGLPTGSDWFGISGSRIGYEQVHPLFLYESLMCLTIFIILNAVSKKRAFSGQIFSLYIVLYSFGRFWLEGMRNQEFILRFGKLGASQVVAFALVVSGLSVYFILRSHSKEKDEQYQSQFGNTFDDEEVLDRAYELLGCEWEDDDQKVTEAFEAIKAECEELIAQGEETEETEELTDKQLKKRQRKEDKKTKKVLSSQPLEDDEQEEEDAAIRAKLKLAEASYAYDYIMGNRRLRAQEAAKYTFNYDSEETV